VHSGCIARGVPPASQDDVGIHSYPASAALVRRCNAFAALCAAASEAAPVCRPTPSALAVTRVCPDDGVAAAVAGRDTSPAGITAKLSRCIKPCSAYEGALPWMYTNSGNLSGSYPDGLHARVWRHAMHPMPGGGSPPLWCLLPVSRLMASSAA
jgi:hypothetical protein